ncbi:ribosomal maturation YjgA family protein [Vibrio campbellii]
MKMFKRVTLTGQPSNMVEETCDIHLRISVKNGLKSLVCFIALVVIALYVRDSFIRPTVGDVLVVVWLYYFLASMFSMHVNWLVSLVVLIAFAVELGQLLQVAVWLGIEPSSPLAVILGATFDWKDLLAYCIGGLLCCWMEKK